MNDVVAGPHPGPRWRDRRGLVALFLASSLVTCTNDRPTAPGGGGRGYLALRPVLASPVDVAAFGLTIDSLRVAAIRPVADTVVDTTVFFDPNAASLSLALPVPLRSASETFVLLLELRAGRRVLFTGIDTVVVSVGAPDTTSAATVTLTYSGPGSGLTRIRIAPVDSVVTEGQTKQFSVTADSLGVPVDSFYVSWSTSDTATAPINGLGVLRAPNARGAVFVRALTPNGVKDSTRVTFIPLPSAIAVASGDGQTAVVATRLPLPLRVRVTASDALGVKGVAVRFQAPAGGSVRDSVVVTDSAGFAEDTVTLGTTAGVQSFQAMVAGLAPAIFPATGTPGAIAPALSVVTVSAGTVASGATVTLRLQTKDAFGNNLTAGGATVVFADSGGTSTGVIGATTDNGDGTYQAAFRGAAAGTATTIKATVNGIAVTTTRPTLTVTAGAISAQTSVVSTSSGTVASGSSATLTLQAKDSAGNLLTVGGATVVFTRAGGTSTGTIGATTDHANGTYTATFSADSAGTTTTIGATIAGVTVVSTTAITVVPGNTVAAQSVITVSADTIPSGGTSTLTLQAKDSAGNNITTGGLTVVFSFSGGTSTGTVAPSPATDNGNGTYTATFTGVTPGTATTIHATIGGVQVTSTLPTITVFSSVHVSDITADSTWTAAASPHLVNGYLKITNGATLTIQAGAVVKFDTGSGLQVGDTAASQSGNLALDGTAGQIVLTANSASPGVGFWKGIEVQRALTGTPWRNVLIEWAGGTRAPAAAVAAEACVLLVNNSGSGVELDALHIRRCNHAAIHHFGGSAHVHRSQIDTVTGSGIHVDFDAQLELDSTTIRGAGQEGLFFGSATARLSPSSANRFLDNVVTGIHLNAFQLPGLLQQDSIGGNGTNLVEVEGGRPDPNVAAFTMFAQRQPPGTNGYLVQNGLLDIGTAAGQALTLDSNLVLRFGSRSGIVIGDSAGAARSGTIVSLGTSRANSPRLTSASATPAPGDWYGLEIGRLSGTTRLANLRIEFAGDSIPGRSAHRFGLLVRSPAPHALSLDSVVVAQSGRAGSDSNAAGIGVLAGGAGVDVRRSVAESNPGYGFVAAGVPNVKLVGDTARGNTIGFGIFTDSGGGAAPAAADSVAANVATGNATYPLRLDIRRLPVLRANALTGNGRDTLILEGGTLTVSDTLPRFPGLPWRVTGLLIQIDSGATFTIAAGDTVAFDSSTGILVGSQVPSALAVDGSTARVLLTASGPLPRGWRGIDWHRMSGSGPTTNNAFRHVDVDRAGFIAPCFGDCSPIPFGALRFTDSLAPTNVDLAIDNVIVRRSNAIALDFQRGGTGTVAIASSQFYLNKPDPMIRARSGSGSRLSITGSDLYHYRGWVIESSYRSISPADSVQAPNNWWGDVTGADTGFTFQDSLGRATTEYNPAVITPFAATPFFPVGSAAGTVTTRDSLLSPVPLGDSVTIHVRVLDARGRGVVGQPVTWNEIPPGASFITPFSSTSDLGGREDARWKFANTAGRLTAHATGGGGFTEYYVDVQPGLTTPGFAWALDAGRSQGTVTPPRAITFTSTNRTGVVVTHAHDQFNNATHPFSICFADVGGACTSFPPYGVVDSTHTDGIDGDTIFFHPTTNQPSAFVLRALYTLQTGGQQADSVIITMAPNAAGVRIDRDQFSSNGVQVVPDTAVFNSICPAGQPNPFCQQEFHAFVVDSALAPAGNQNARFQWSLLPPAGAPITFTTRGTPANDSALVTTQANGFVRLVANDSSGNNFGADTLPILVQQLPALVLISPDSQLVLVGGTATFRGAAVDQGGDTMPGVAIHWRPDFSFNRHITIIDTATANQAVVRLDSTPLGAEYVAALAVRGPGDTAYGFARVVNPIIERQTVGLQPWAIAANSQTHAVYVGHQGGQLYRVNGTTNAVTDSTTSGTFVAALTVNPAGNRLYAANSAGVEVFDATTLVSQGTISAGTNQLGVTNRQGLTVDSANSRVYVTVDIGSAASQPVLRQIDGTTNTVVAGADAPLPAKGASAAFNPANGLVYVAIPDSNLVVVVDPVAHTIVKRIAVGSQPFALAVNPVTNRIYVIDQLLSGQLPFNLYVIDGATNSLVATVPQFTYLLGSVAVDVVNNRIYVGARSSPFLLVFDGATESLAGLLSAGTTFSDQEFGVAVDAGNGQVYTANYLSSSISRLKY